MNAKIKYHCIETISGAKGNYIQITIRKAHSRFCHHTTIDLKNVSDHWLDEFDDLTSGLECVYVHRFQWGFSVLQFRPLKGEK